jgi:hypothetical protein
MLSDKKSVGKHSDLGARGPPICWQGLELCSFSWYRDRVPYRQVVSDKRPAQRRQGSSLPLAIGGAGRRRPWTASRVLVSIVKEPGSGCSAPDGRVRSGDSLEFAFISARGVRVR